MSRVAGQAEKGQCGVVRRGWPREALPTGPEHHREAELTLDNRVAKEEKKAPRTALGICLRRGKHHTALTAGGGPTGHPVTLAVRAACSCCLADSPGNNPDSLSQALDTRPTSSYC